MSICSKKLRPEGLDIQICTSDVMCYDGPVFQCIQVNPGDGLNEILSTIDALICGLGGSITPPTAADIAYNGTLDFGCIVIPGSSSVEDVLELFGTQICTNTTAIEDLTSDDIAIGTVSTFCYTPPGSVDTVSEMFSFIFENMCNLQLQIDNLMGSFTAPLEGSIDGVLNGTDVVITGGEYTDSGLSVDIDDGSGGDSEYIVVGKWVQVPLDTVPLTANADNYLDFDTGTMAYAVTAVTIGFPAPPVVGIRLWKFETNLLNVVVATDMRNYSWLATHQIVDLAVTTAKIANLAVTGAKLESVVAAATIGDPNFIELTYDAKGRITATALNIDVTGAASGDVLSYDGVEWVPISLAFLTGSGTANTVARFNSPSSLTDSTIFDDGTTAAIGIAPAANIQFTVRTTLTDYAIFANNVNSGVSSLSYGILSNANGGTVQNIGVQGNGGGTSTPGVPQPSSIGVVGTASTTNAWDACGGCFSVATSGAASGNTFGLYVTAFNSGSGEAIGIAVPDGGMVLGDDTKDPSAIIEFVSISQGILWPRMQAGQASAITPVDGLSLYVTTTNGTFTSVGFWGYENGAWVKL